MNNRNIFLDILKGGAIIVVILYHLGIMSHGYLGVELFLVISGYLTTKGVIKMLESRTTIKAYWTFINSRLVRLWPLLLIISIISLVGGWLWMLPIHFKLNCESVIGSCTFLNNFVQLITTGNYWTSTNEYKPLMHTWYVGILFQFYLLYPIIFIVNKKYAKDWKFSSFVTLVLIFILSFTLYFLPILSTAQNFYLLPSRLFEFISGGLIAIYADIKYKSKSEKKMQSILIVLAISIIALLLTNYSISAEKIRLLFTVAVSTIFIIIVEFKICNLEHNKWMKPLALIGTISYSLYLSHQVLFGLYRYAFNDVFSVFSYVLIFFLTLLLGFIIYYMIENPLSKYVGRNAKRMYSVNAMCFVLTCIISLASFYFYKQNGLVRDIPELEMYIGENSETPEEYNGRVHAYNKDFDENGRKNLLVIGDSFGRDRVNILIESGIDSIMNISYRTEPDEITIDRINKSDYVFIANNTYLVERYEQILPLALTKKFYRVGRKSYGSWIGIVYNNNRYSDSYYSQLVPETEATIKTNSIEMKVYGERFIDMMGPLKNKNGLISIFDENKHLITQDGIHLTKAGAQKYAKILNIEKLFK